MVIRELAGNHRIIEGEKHRALYDGDKLKRVFLQSGKMFIYNYVFSLDYSMKDIRMGKESFSIIFMFRNHGLPLERFRIRIEEKAFPLEKGKEEGIWSVEVPYAQLSPEEKFSSLEFFFEDEHGYYFQHPVVLKGYKKNDHLLYFSKIVEIDGKSVYLYETNAGALKLAWREKNVTDSGKSSFMIRMAYLMSRRTREKGEPVILMFEKFAAKCEESARNVFEKLMADGRKNVYFILDETSPDYPEMSRRYGKNVVKKHTLRHYYLFFISRGIIATETVQHCMDLSIHNELVWDKIFSEEYYYFFLGHGIMYMYSLEGRYQFSKGYGFRNNAYVVASSDEEIRHYVEKGNFCHGDFIKCGLPKFDTSFKKEDADKIVIMPTTRMFEYGTITDAPEESTYYRFVVRIIDAVPEEYRDKVVFIPHPLYKKAFERSSVAKFMPEDFRYDQLLQETRLLITDYSSISYDAFYRGGNVLFAWMDKDMCLAKLGYQLMLNDENAFADIAYDDASLRALIRKNYEGRHEERYTDRYRRIVEFTDNRNTERFVDYLYRTPLFHHEIRDISGGKLKVEGLKDQIYTGEKIRQDQMVLTYEGIKMTEKLDYRISYENNKDAGTARMIIEGIGAYCGKAVFYFIIQKSINTCRISMEDHVLHLRDGKDELTEGTDYTVTCERFDDVGLTRYVASGIHPYAGTKIKYAENE